MWIATALIFLHNLRIQRKSVTKSVDQNLALVSLVLITIIASMSGSLFLSRTIPSYYENHVEDRWSMPALRPDPVVQLLGMLYFFGTIFSELGWITHALLSRSNIFGGVSVEGKCLKRATYGKNERLRHRCEVYAFSFLTVGCASPA
jgi:hypothetical protein